MNLSLRPSMNCTALALDEVNVEASVKGVPYFVVWCSVVQCAAVCCSVLHAVRYSILLQCVAKCCNVLQCVTVCWGKTQQGQTRTGCVEKTNIWHKYQRRLCYPNTPHPHLASSTSWEVGASSWVLDEGFLDWNVFYNVISQDYEVQDARWACHVFSLEKSMTL